MKYPKGGFEQNISFEIKGNHAVITRKNSAVGRKIICTYSFNEEEFFQ